MSTLDRILPAVPSLLRKVALAMALRLDLTLGAIFLVTLLLAPFIP